MGGGMPCNTRQRPAEVVVELNKFTGKERLRCTACNKVAFSTEEQAKEAAEKISERTPMVHYRGHNGGKECGWWHLSRKRQK